MTAVHLWAGSAFCDAIVREGLGKAGAVYTFNSAGLGLLNQARELGLATVVEQTIAPAPIESFLKSQDFVSLPVIIGDKRKFLSCLIIPNFEKLAAWAKENGA